MAALKSNGIIKYLVFIVIGVLISISLVVYKGNKSAKSGNDQPTDSVIYDLSETEQKELGLTAGDTPHDTLKTLLGEMKRAREDVEAVKQENQKLKNENATLKNNSNAISQQISEALEQKQLEFDHALANLRAEMDTVKNGHPLSSNTSNQMNTTPYPIGGLGLDSEPSTPIQNTQNNKGLPSIPLGGRKEKQVKWLDPADAVYKDKSGKVVPAYATDTQMAFPNPFKALDESVLGEAADKIIQNPSSPHSSVKDNHIPFFTLPMNSTLLGSISMTALIGRVPLNGSVVDPYPFKIMIGRDNLIANGIELPNVEGAIVSGTATGDWTLSCVSGKVDNITFVFSDGRIATNQDHKTNNGQDKGIGWLSNQSGVPCISGERKTNAPEYLTSQFLLAGAGAAAQGLSQGQTTTVVDNGSVIGAVTGDQGKFILGQAIGGGLKETTEWLKQRYGQTFDAIYVPPGQPVAVHITQELRIDYNPNGRKVKYQNAHSSRQLD